MRKISEVARLHASGLSIRKIAGGCNLARSTVSDYLGRLSEAGLSWPFPAGMSEEELDGRLFRHSQVRDRDLGRPLPEWARVHKELRRKGVTLRLLWLEYREEHPDGYGYSGFCEHYRRWNRTVDVCMRQVHRAGEKLFVDYAGMSLLPGHHATGQGLRRGAGRSGLPPGRAPGGLFVPEHQVDPPDR